MYFDFAATTPVLENIKENASQLLSKYENPSSLHLNSQRIKNEIEEARSMVANFLNASKEQIFFTSGATESNNTVIKGFYLKNEEVKHHYLTSSIEHPSVLEPVSYMNRYSNFSYDILSPEYLLNLEKLKQKVDEKPPSFCSFMMANNETGTIFPIQDISKILNDYNTFFHVDATQALGKIPIDVNKANIDALSFSGHKIFAPKGIGVLYLKDPKSVTPLIHGGGQENGIRCGTENVFAILSLKIAIEYLTNNFHDICSHYTKCRTYFLELLEFNDIPYILNENNGLTNILSVRFPMKGDAIADILNFKYGNMISVGSACSSNKNEKKLSYVLKSMGLSDTNIQKTTRISFGINTELSHIESLVNNISNVLSVYN